MLGRSDSWSRKRGQICPWLISWPRDVEQPVEYESRADWTSSPFDAKWAKSRPEPLRPFAAGPSALSLSLEVRLYLCRILSSLSPEDIRNYVSRPVRGLPLARESSDAVEMIAQGNDRRLLSQFSILFDNLSESHAREEAVANATPIFRVALQATFADKVRDRSSRAAVEKSTRSICGRFAEPSLLQKANIANPMPSGKNRIVRNGVVQLNYFEWVPRGREQCRLDQRGVICSLFKLSENRGAEGRFHAGFLGQGKD